MGIGKGLAQGSITSQSLVKKGQEERRGEEGMVNEGKEVQSQRPQAETSEGRQNFARPLTVAKVEKNSKKCR